MDEERAVRPGADGGMYLGFVLAEKPELVAVRHIVVAPRDVVYVKGILEASEGLALLFALHGGELALVAARSREPELDELLADLAAEISLRVRSAAARGAALAAGISLRVRSSAARDGEHV